MKNLPDPTASNWRPDIAERQSSSWSNLLRYLQDRLSHLQMQNEDVNNTEQKTAAIRGAIKEVKSLLEKDEPLPNVQQVSDFQ